MNYLDWYTDLADVYRVVPEKTGNLTRHRRENVLSAVPCRIYRGAGRPVDMRQDAARVKQSSKLAADNAADIREGDELIITRGGRLGQARDKTGPSGDRPAGGGEGEVNGLYHDRLPEQDAEGPGGPAEGHR